MTIHDFAATSKLEASYLSRISERLSERQAFAEYMTWLSSWDTEAARFVRAYTEHAFEGGPIPEAVPHRGVSWHRMLGHGMGSLGSSWHADIGELPDAAHAPVESWVRPIVTMTATPGTVQELPIGGSRFLGCPDLPQGFVWPVCERGPLRFQAQINLWELRHSVATERFGLPEAGWLVLFAFDDDGKHGIQPGVLGRTADGGFDEIPDLTSVAYLPAAVELVRFPIPQATVCPKGEGFACQVTFGETLDIPVAEDTEDPRLMEDEDVFYWMEEIRMHKDCSHKLLGYPSHGRTSNTCPGPDWLNLFTLASDEATGWCWCDGQRLDVFVHSDGLRTRTFRPCYGYAA